MSADVLAADDCLERDGGCRTGWISDKCPLSSLLTLRPWPGLVIVFHWCCKPAGVGATSGEVRRRAVSRGVHVRPGVVKRGAQAAERVGKNARPPPQPHPPLQGRGDRAVSRRLRRTQLPGKSVMTLSAR